MTSCIKNVPLTSSAGWVYSLTVSSTWLIINIHMDLIWRY